MLRSEKLKPKEKRYTPQTPRFPGITRAAKKFGVTRVHLWFVLRGVRENRELVRRYEAFRKAEAEAAK